MKFLEVERDTGGYRMLASGRQDGGGAGGGKTDPNSSRRRYRAPHALTTLSPLSGTTCMSCITSTYVKDKLAEYGGRGRRGSRQ
mmetsp:Transcript_15829/g.38937  ORF Transcript_15829/g.38937 Transcript_15829/m.38937 type:complete len:84 (-) Transcript_15829:677-928(-)